MQLAPDFLVKIATALSSRQNVSKVIITGTEITHGERVYPHKPSFLGFQSIDYRAGEELCSIVINATVFPCSLFENVQFDENLVYGSDEVDISAQAVYRSGYRIYLEEHAANFHFPSRVNRDYYSPALRCVPDLCNVQEVPKLAEETGESSDFPGTGLLT